MNRDLLKEAIADAKAVKETAIANAKAALEEAFTPYLKEKLAAKLAEMDEMDEAELDEAKMDEKEMKENFDMDETKEMDEAYEMDEMKKDMDEAYEMDEAKEEMDEMDLDELLRELDEMEEGKKEDMMEGEEDLINDPKTPTAHGNVAEEEEVEVGEEEDEEIDLENMTEEDLKSFIESVIADMVAAGELEGEVEGEEGEEGEGEEEESSEEEEISIDELLDETSKEEKMEEGKEADDKKKMEEELAEVKKELEEALAALAEVKTDLNEVNLLNAKLLYTNKIFRAKNLTESQKVKVLEAFDKATTAKEAKLVYETLSQGVANEKKTTVNESLLAGGASKVSSVASTKKPILEVNDQFARWQTLAGIKK